MNSCCFQKGSGSIDNTTTFDNLHLVILFPETVIKRQTNGLRAKLAKTFVIANKCKLGIVDLSRLKFKEQIRQRQEDKNENQF